MQSLAYNIVPKIEQDEQFAGLADSDDEDDEAGNFFYLPIRTPLMEAKKGAITALGEMAAHTGSVFVPHLELSMEALKQAAASRSPLIKAEVADALGNMVKPSISAHHAATDSNTGGVQWEKGKIDGPNPMHAHTADVAKAVLVELETLMKDDDKTTVGKSCEAIQVVIELCGPHSLAPLGREVLENALELLKQEAPCQVDEDEYYGDAGGGGGEEDEEDKDAYMLSVFDMIGGIARVMGDHFIPQLKEFLPVIGEYTKPSRSSGDRSMGVGCLGDVANEVEAIVQEYWQSLFLPAVLESLADEDDNARRNAAFCTGVCCQALGESAAAQYYPQLLKAISPLFSVDVTSGETSAACVDNATAAIARMIMAAPSHVPMSQVLPVMLRALPLKNDMTENETVYNCLLGLIQMNHPDTLPNRAEFRRVFTEATAETSKVDPEIQDKLKAALQAWN